MQGKKKKSLSQMVGYFSGSTPQWGYARFCSAAQPDLCFLCDPHVCPQIEKRMELVRLVSHNLHKRLASCLQGQLGTDAEKRHVRKRLISGLKPAQGRFKPGA